MSALPFVASYLVACLGTILVREASTAIGFVNTPNELVPQHTRATAYGGGIAILLGLAAGLALARSDVVLLWSAGLAVLLGTLDDAYRLSVRAKLVGQALVATVFVLTIPDQFLGGWPEDTLVLWVAVITLMNAVNLTDVCDGLVGGLGLISLAALAIITDSIALGLGAAAVAGFLVFNCPPATIFLGDAGSHLVGLLLAFGAARLVEQHGTLRGGAILLLVTFLFLFELVLLISVRHSNGRPFWLGSPDHFSLRLQSKWFNRWQTIGLSWSVALVSASVAFFSTFSEPWVCFSAIGALLLLGIIAGRFLVTRTSP